MTYNVKLKTPKVQNFVMMEWNCKVADRCTRHPGESPGSFGRALVSQSSDCGTILGLTTLDSGKLAFSKLVSCAASV